MFWLFAPQTVPGVYTAEAGAPGSDVSEGGRVEEAEAALHARPDLGTVVETVELVGLEVPDVPVVVTVAAPYEVGARNGDLGGAAAGAVDLLDDAEADARVVTRRVQLDRPWPTLTMVAENRSWSCPFAVVDVEVGEPRHGEIRVIEGPAVRAGWARTSDTAATPIASGRAKPMLMSVRRFMFLPDGRGG